MCERATVSRSQVLIEDILNGQFIKTLPTTFKKVQGNQRKVINENTAGIGGGKSDPSNKGGPELNKRGKKRVINQELAGSSVKKTAVQWVQINGWGEVEQLQSKMQQELSGLE